MDTDPARHELNMARWTFAGSLGVVAGPLALGGTALLGLRWRGLARAIPQGKRDERERVGP